MVRAQISYIALALYKFDIDIDIGVLFLRHDVAKSSKFVRRRGRKQSGGSRSGIDGRPGGTLPTDVG